MYARINEIISILKSQILRIISEWKQEKKKEKSSEFASTPLYVYLQHSQIDNIFLSENNRMTRN